MNKNKLKFVKSLLVTLSIVISMVPGRTFAQDVTVTVEQCELDFQTFISSVISYDGFTEYWEDIFVRYNKNICYYMDIQNVLKQIETVRSQIRTNFLSCNTAQAIALKDRYYELEAELFFLRNFVDISKSEIKDIPDEKVYKLLRGDFVLNKAYFDKFKQKYGSRVSTTYANCEDPGLKQLINKWNSLVDNFKAMGGTGDAIKDKWNKTINAPSKRTGPLLIDFTFERLNNLAAPKTPEEVYADLQKDLPEGSEPTVDQLQLTIIQTQQDYNKKVETTSLKAQYEALYKQGGDTITKSYSDMLDELNKILNDTFPTLDNLKNCSKKSGDRQCQ